MRSPGLEIFLQLLEAPEPFAALQALKDHELASASCAVNNSKRKRRRDQGLTWFFKALVCYINGASKKDGFTLEEMLQNAHFCLQSDTQRLDSIAERERVAARERAPSKRSSQMDADRYWEAYLDGVRGIFPKEEYVSLKERTAHAMGCADSRQRRDVRTFAGVLSALSKIFDPAADGGEA